MTVHKKRDYYDVLGVDRQANLDEIKRAYRKLAIKHHPDHNPDDWQAEEAFKEVTEAYATLSDTDRRHGYDKFGHAGSDGSGAGFDKVDFSSIQEVLGGLFDEVFGRKTASSRVAPRDLNYELEFTLEEAALGEEKPIEYERSVPCNRCGASRSEPGTKNEPCASCQGRGQVRHRVGLLATYRACPACQGAGVRISVPCMQCQGSGQVKRSERLNVRIPAGIENGAVRTIRGYGEETADAAGNLHVKVRIKNHPFFERDGADVICEVPVSYSQAALGADMEVPTLEGKVKMKLPAGTQSGHVFRLRGKGLPVFGGYGKGDQLVRVVVEVPEQLNERQRELLKLLGEEMNAETLPKQRSFMEKLKGIFG
jgi:molecular chaperone DnaJ